MSADYFLTQNDIPSTPLVAVLIDAKGNVVDLSNAISIRFLMRQKGSSVLKVDLPAAVVNPPGADGKVSYAWQAGDTDTAGDYDAEFEVRFPGNKILTFPTTPKIRIRVVREVG